AGRAPRGRARRERSRQAVKASTTTAVRAGHFHGPELSWVAVLAEGPSTRAARGLSGGDVMMPSIPTAAIRTLWSSDSNDPSQAHPSSQRSLHAPVARWQSV